jgi:hypothetical protein
VGRAITRPPETDVVVDSCNDHLEIRRCVYPLLRLTDEPPIRLSWSSSAKNKRVGVVAAKIVGSDGSFEFSQRRFPRLRSAFAQAFFLHRLWPKAPWSDEVVSDVVAYEAGGSPDWVSGACLIVRRAVLIRSGASTKTSFSIGRTRTSASGSETQPTTSASGPGRFSVHLGGASAPRAASSRER